jgi:DNA-binding XRE family transcriptional regulator
MLCLYVCMNGDGISQVEVGRRVGVPRTAVITVIKNKKFLPKLKVLLQ